MSNGATSYDSLSKMKDQYDAIYQQNSSHRQSLLVSPYCSRYQRDSYQNHHQQKSLLDYIRPFQGEHLNKTQTKQKIRVRKQHQYDNRKKTEPDFNQKLLFGQHSQQKQLSILREAIKQKDHQISFLQNYITQMSKNVGNTLQECKALNQDDAIKKEHNEKKMHLKQAASKAMKKGKSGLKGQKKIETVSSEKQNVYFQMQIYQLKKELKFVVHNNQQLYEQVRRLSEYSKRLKKTLEGALVYTRDVEQKLFEASQRGKVLEEINAGLIKEKEEMLENYEMEVELFKKMKRVWEDSNQVKVEPKLNRTASKRNYKAHCEGIKSGVGTK